MPFLVNSVGWMITRFQPRSHGGSSYKLIFGREYSGEIAEMCEQLWYRLAARVTAGRGKWEAIFARGIWVGKSEIDDTHLVMDLERAIQKVRTVRRLPVEFRWNAEMLQDIRVTPWKPTPGKSAQVVGRNMYITERMIDAHGLTDSCRKCSAGQGNHSAECRQRFEKIQYDLLQEKLRQAPIIPEESGEQTVVTRAPAASETDTNVMERSAAPSASDRIRQKRGGLHGPEHPDVSEPVQTNVSSLDVARGNSVSPAPASSSGPGEAPVQERLKRVDTDEEMRTGESDVKKPRVAAIGALTVCELAVCEDEYDQSFDPAWDLIPRRSARCDAKCREHGHRCQLREGHFKNCACRRCLMSHIGHLTVESADQEEEIMDVSGELHGEDTLRLLLRRATG